MIKEQFIPYELALKLKELGFDEECFGFYSNNKIYYEDNITSNKILTITNKIRKETLIAAPLWQQAFDFIREFCNWSFCIKRSHKQKDYEYFFEIFNPLLQTEVKSKKFNTYQEARLACLEKLIEIVENNNK